MRVLFGKQKFHIIGLQGFHVLDLGVDESSVLERSMPFGSVSSNNRPNGLDTLLIGWPVMKGLVIMHLWFKQEAHTSDHYLFKAKCLQCTLFREN